MSSTVGSETSEKLPDAIIGAAYAAIAMRIAASHASPLRAAAGISQQIPLTIGRITDKPMTVY